jgi:hypothetical protein
MYEIGEIVRSWEVWLDKQTILLQAEMTSQRVGAQVQIPFFYVDTGMPGSLDARASLTEREDHREACETKAQDNKTISDFPALLECLSMPVRGGVKKKLMFHIMGREIVSRSLDEALEEFKPTLTSNLLQFTGTYFLGPIAAGFVGLFTLTIAREACVRLGLVAGPSENIDLGMAEEEFHRPVNSKVGGLGYSILRGYFIAIPEYLFRELFDIVARIGPKMIFDGVVGYTGVKLLTAYVNNLVESKRWAEIAAVIRKHAFRIHLQWVIMNGNDMWE